MSGSSCRGARSPLDDTAPQDAVGGWLAQPGRCRRRPAARVPAGASSPRTSCSKVCETTSWLVVDESADRDVEGRARRDAVPVEARAGCRANHPRERPGADVLGRASTRRARGPQSEQRRPLPAPLARLREGRPGPLRRARCRSVRDSADRAASLPAMPASATIGPPATWLPSARCGSQPSWLSSSLSAPAVRGCRRRRPATERIGHVADGDTVVLQSGATIRLVQIDTPEVFFRAGVLRRAGQRRDEAAPPEEHSRAARAGPDHRFRRSVRTASCATSSARTGSTSTSSSLPTASQRRTSSRAIEATRPRSSSNSRSRRSASVSASGAPARQPPTPRNTASTPGRRSSQPTSAASRRTPSSICASSTRLNESRTLSPPLPPGRTARRARTPMRRRALGERGRVEAVRQREPREEAAPRRRPARAPGTGARARRAGLALAGRATGTRRAARPSGRDGRTPRRAAGRARRRTGRCLLRDDELRRRLRWPPPSRAAYPGKNVFDDVRPADDVGPERSTGWAAPAPSKPSSRRQRPRRQEAVPAPSSTSSGAARRRGHSRPGSGGRGSCRGASVAARPEGVELFEVEPGRVERHGDDLGLEAADAMIAPRYVGASTTTGSPRSRNELPSSSSASIAPLVISSSSSSGRRPWSDSIRRGERVERPASPRVGAY